MNSHSLRIHDRNSTFHRAVFIILFLSAVLAFPASGEDSRELTLSEAISLALVNNPSLNEASEKEKAARAVELDARSSRKVQARLDSRQTSLNKVPEMSVDPRVPAIALGDKNSLTSTVTVQKVLSSGGRLEGMIRQARGSREVADLGRERTRQMVAFEAEIAFLQLVLAQGELGVAQGAFDTASEYMRVAQSRFESKSVAEFDVLRAGVQVEESRQDVIKTRAGIEIAKAALIQAIGLRQGNFIATETGLIASFPIPSLEESLKIACQQRPEMQSADWRIDSAKAGIKTAKGESRPTLSISSSYQKMDHETAFQMNQWTAILAAGIPLVDGGHGRSKVQSARAQLEQQKAGRDATTNQIEKEVRQAHARLSSAHSQIDVAVKRVEFAEEMLRITHVRYSSGMSTATEVADAQTSLTRARQGYIRALSDMRMAAAEFRLAMGEHSTVKEGN
ncbi:MAG: TolC family protein [Candidatus Riflebacteria bacterium]|nr:TolC family protein [Candidatus Riflebacteria bacterium]